MILWDIFSGRKRFFEVPPDPRPNFERRSDYADRICPPPCMSEVEAFFKALKDNPVIEWGQARLNSQLEKLSAMKKRPNQAKVDKVRRQIMLRHCKERRREQLRRLKEWETEVNSLSSENAKIAVENDHDLEGPPRHMTYINSYKVSLSTKCRRKVKCQVPLTLTLSSLSSMIQPAAGITIPDDPPIGCECPDGGACSSRTQKSCCSGLNGHQFAYNFQGKLRVKVGAPIYECNKRCKCSRTCKNRVVQKGRKVGQELEPPCPVQSSPAAAFSPDIHICGLFPSPGEALHLPDQQRLRVGGQDPGKHQGGHLRGRVRRRGHHQRGGRGEGPEIRWVTSTSILGFFLCHENQRSGFQVSPSSTCCRCRGADVPV